MAVVFFHAKVLPTGKITALQVPAWKTGFIDWWDHYKQNSLIFSAASFLKIYITCSEPRSRQYGGALYPTVLPNPLISAVLVSVSSRTDHELFAKTLSKF